MTTTISVHCNGKDTVSKSDDNNTLEFFNPWNNEKLITLIEPTQEEVKNVITNSVETFEKKRLTPQERYEILSKAAEILKERKREVAKVISKDNGKPIKDAETEVMRAHITFQLSAEEARKINGYTEEIAPPVQADYSLGITIREPVGVVCAITPFNFPLALAAHKIGPAIAAGNTVIFKPSEQTTNTGQLLVDILHESGLPDGFLNMVVGRGNTVGETLLQDERINFYTFTGSARVGEYIKSKAGFRRVALELGSNAPNIVHHDADLDLAVNSLVKAAFSYSGQVCISAQRIYVHSKIFNKFVEKFTHLTKDLKLGNPLEDATDIGPVINKANADRIVSWIDEARESGAEILHGGRIFDGNVVEPTVVVNPNPSIKLMCEEVFGPVVSINSYDCIDDLITSVNASKYGLQAGVFTRDIHTAINLARKIHVGGVNINNASISRADSMPYGGVKQSGVGREGPRAAIEDMTEVKVITFNTINNQ